jgi:hypothetical protein
MFGKSIDMDIMDSKVSSMAVTSALVLTIPFGLFQALGNNFWSELRRAIDNCGHSNDIASIDNIKKNLLNNLNGALAASIIGILLSTFYYLLKPSSARSMTLLMKKKIRILVLVLFLTNFSAMVCAINLAYGFNQFYLVEYDTDLCKNGFNDNGRGVTMIIFTGVGFLVCIAFMW